MVLMVSQGVQECLFELKLHAVYLARPRIAAVIVHSDESRFVGFSGRGWSIRGLPVRAVGLAVRAVGLSVLAVGLAVLAGLPVVRQGRHTNTLLALTSPGEGAGVFVLADGAPHVKVDGLGEAGSLAISYV